MMPFYKICVRFTLTINVFAWFSNVWHSLPRPVDCVAVRERRNYHILFLTPIPVGSNCSRTCTTMFFCCLFIFLHISVWPYTAQCVLCKVYFSAQPNKLRPILKFEFGNPLNMCLSQLVWVCGKYICSHFCDFETLGTWFPLKYVPVSSPSSLNMPHHHHHHH